MTTPQKQPEFHPPLSNTLVPVRYVSFGGPAVSETTRSRDELIELRKKDRRWFGVLDVTPSPVAVHVNIALGVNTWWRHTSTPLRGFKCQDCAKEGPQWTVCPTCNGSRRVYTTAWR